MSLTIAKRFWFLIGLSIFLAMPLAAGTAWICHQQRWNHH